MEENTKAKAVHKRKRSTEHHEKEAIDALVMIEKHCIMPKERNVWRIQMKRFVEHYSQLHSTRTLDHLRSLLP